MATICIFEDSGFENLLPLTYTRAVYELRCGIMQIFEKIVHLYPETSITLYCRDYIADTLRERSGFPVNQKVNDDICLFLNGRVISLPKDININQNIDEVGIYGNTIIYAMLKKEKAENIGPSFFLKHDSADKLKKEGVKLSECRAEMINYPWDLVHHNAEQIEKDFNILIPKGEVSGTIYSGVHLLNPSQIYIGKGSSVKPGCVLDAEEGPILIGENVTLFPNCSIKGPAFIGSGSQIKMGAKIYEGTSIGEVCKVGGEVEEIIIQSYTNKQHDGFLGHSYLGMWCNIGAGTSTSDLKNNYSNVKVPIRGEMVDSGSMFVGLTMGDHSKSGINTMFNTGTVVGVMVNVFGADYPPKYIPSFAWGGSKGLSTYNLEKAIVVAKRVMGRRKKELTHAQEKLLRKIFEITAEERKML